MSLLFSDCFTKLYAAEQIFFFVYFFISGLLAVYSHTRNTADFITMIHYSLKALSCVICRDLFADSLIQMSIIKEPITSRDLIVSQFRF